MTEIIVGRTIEGTRIEGYVANSLLVKQLMIPQNGHIVRIGIIVKNTAGICKLKVGLYDSSRTKVVEAPETIIVDGISEIPIDAYQVFSGQQINAVMNGHLASMGLDLTEDPNEANFILPHIYDGTLPLTIEAPEATTWSWNIYVVIETDYAPPVNHTIQVIISPNGTTNPSGILEIQDGKDLTVTATPNESYILDYWLKNGSENIGTDNPITLTVMEPFTLEAIFKAGEQPPPPPPPAKTVAARSYGGLGLPAVLLHGLWRLREKHISKEVHRKLHPLV